MPFSLARTIFNDRRLLTLADADHSQSEERWFSIGSASNGMILSVAYLWTNKDETLVQIRLISARKATKSEMLQYKENL